MEYGHYKYNEYRFHHYVATSEFGIMPTEYRQFAGSSRDRNRIIKLNELKSKWGFNYIAACIGVSSNISAIVNAGYPISSNYLATGFATGGILDRNTILNAGNGLSSSTYFWGYYIDEPYSHTGIPYLTQADFKNFRDFVKSTRPNSLFGFGETNIYTANRYTHNPYFWYSGYYTNYHQTSVDFVMCTRYNGYYNEDDQRDLWSELSNSYSAKFNRTWISANLDNNEFDDLLGHAMNKGAAPWLYQMEDATDLTDNVISIYCDKAWKAGFLDRYDEKLEVWMVCKLNHKHNPNYLEECAWQKEKEIYLGIVKK